MTISSVRYMVTRQGNRNLALGRAENIFHNNAAAARKAAADFTRRDGEPWYVYEVDAVLKYAYVTDVREETWNGGAE